MAKVKCSTCSTAYDFDILEQCDNCKLFHCPKCYDKFTCKKCNNNTRNIEYNYKDLDLDINPNLVSFQDIYTTGWYIRDENERHIADWHLFEEDAWKEAYKALGGTPPTAL